MNIDITEAVSADKSHIISIWEQTGLTRPWNDPEQDVVNALSGKTSTILIAKESGTILGTCMAGYDGHRGWIYYLAVMPSHQKKGLGKKLFEAAEEWLYRQGAPKIMILIREDNQKVMEFYKGIGFERGSSLLMGKVIDK